MVCLQNSNNDTNELNAPAGEQPESSHSKHHVLTLYNKATTARWMTDEVELAKVPSTFRQMLFNTSHSSFDMGVRRIIFMQSASGMSEIYSSVHFRVEGCATTQACYSYRFSPDRASAGFSRRRIERVFALQQDLVEEFDRYVTNAAVLCSTRPKLIFGNNEADNFSSDSFDCLPFCLYSRRPNCSHLCYNICAQLVYW